MMIPILNVRVLGLRFVLLLLVGVLGGCSQTEAVERGPGVRFDPVLREIEGFPVYIEPALLEGEHAGVGARSIAMLRNHLERIVVLVPEPALSKLRQVGIWIEVDHPLTDIEPGPYHGGRQWLVDNGWDPRLENCVHITRAESLLERHHMLKHPFVVVPRVGPRLPR